MHRVIRSFGLRRLVARFWKPRPGYVFAVDDDGAIAVDDDGAWGVEEE